MGFSLDFVEVNIKSELLAKEFSRYKDLLLSYFEHVHDSFIEHSEINVDKDTVEMFISMSDTSFDYDPDSVDDIPSCLIGLIDEDHLEYWSEEEETEHFAELQNLIDFLEKNAHSIVDSIKSLTWKHSSYDSDDICEEDDEDYDEDNPGGRVVADFKYEKK